MRTHINNYNNYYTRSTTRISSSILEAVFSVQPKLLGAQNGKERERILVTRQTEHAQLQSSWLPNNGTMYYTTITFVASAYCIWQITNHPIHKPAYSEIKISDRRSSNAIRLLSRSNAHRGACNTKR